MNRSLSGSIVADGLLWPSCTTWWFFPSSHLSLPDRSNPSHCQQIQPPTCSATSCPLTPSPRVQISPRRQHTSSALHSSSIPL